MSHTSEGEGAVVTSVLRAPRRRRRRRLAAIAAAVSLVVAGTGLYWVFGRPAPKTPTEKAEVVSKRAAALDKSSDFDGQVKELEDYLATNPPAEQASRPTYKLAAAYLNAKQYEKAIDTFEMLPKLDIGYTIDAYHGQATAYEKLGKNAEAVAMYKKAVADMKAENPQEYASLIAIDEEIIRGLVSRR